jgi:hypothetical protein
MAEPGDSQSGDDTRPGGIVRIKAIVAELADACGSALATLAEEQSARAAGEIGAIAEAARCAARSFERSQSPQIARGIDRAAEGIDGVAQLIRARDWGEIAATTADFARCGPGVFGLGAMAIGFVVGRLLMPAVGREPTAEEALAPRGAPAGEQGDGKAADGVYGRWPPESR